MLWITASHLADWKKGTGQQADVDGSSNITINYSTFLKIIGKERKEIFKQIHNAADDQDEHFFTLYRLWKYFNDRFDEEHSIDQNNTRESLQVYIGQQSFQAQFEDSQEEIVHEIAQTYLESEVAAEVVEPAANTSTTQTQRTQLGDYLVWPESPKRKGKRQIERLPFAITSQKYKEMLESKNAAKLQAEQEKERRKKKNAKRLEQINPKLSLNKSNYSLNA